MPRGSAQVAMEEEGGSSSGGGDSGGGAGGGRGGVAGIRFLSGTCPDPKCQTRLYCMSSYQSIECTGCGQLHTQSALQNLKEEEGDVYNTALLAFKTLIAGVKPEPGTDNVKVHGLSNYLCKLLSHLLSRYGMDKASGRAKLLTEMGQPEIFDCGVLCDFAFHIDPEHLNVTGYGRDKSGGVQYLADTLNVVREANESEDRLVPIHADGDGHCLVHAVSRALVGRELFWHPLRLNLMQHLRSNLPRYKELLHNFVDVDEWEDIISECQPSFVPKDGETVGLRNIHIFGLANVLKRPIILLDSLSGINSSGDYSAVFLPGLLTPDQCRNKDGVLNFPLCIAWSSQGRNHFIPLVGISEKPCPRLPRYMLQSTWGGLHPSLLDQFITFDDQGCCSIGGPRSLNHNYIQRLVSAMEEVFHDTYRVRPALVADVHQYIFRSKGFVGVTLEMVIDKTHQLVQDRALVRCLRCSSLIALEVTEGMLRKGGRLYELATKEIGELNTSKLYTFTDYQISCRYNTEKDCLVPELNQSCPFCQSEHKFRYVRADSTVEYHEGDITLEPAGPNAQCSCGFKHYYNGKFYDHRPREIPVPLEWGGKSRVDVVQWWENESDPELNSNVYQVAQDLVLKHFPGEFGIELLQQKIVSAILHLTESRDKKEVEPCETGASRPKWNAEEASKIILSGYQSQGIHKEELRKSESERQVKKKIEANAPQQQCRKSGDFSTSPAGGSKRQSPSRTSLTKTRASSAVKASSSSSSSAPSTPPATPKSTPNHEAAAASPPQSSTSTPPPTPRAVTKEKKIRVVAAGGLSATVTLAEDVTFAQLQKLVYEETLIPPEHQKLRVGFPPKILAAPTPGGEEEAAFVPLNHGDKINVENTATTNTTAATAANGHAPTTRETTTGTSQWSSPRSSVKGHVDARMPNEEALLNALSANHSGGDSLDHSLISLGILAETVGVDIWSLVQSQPHHFSRGGLYYRQAQRDVGLVPDKHFCFPVFPGKTFVYNAVLDRLELCLKDLGHFEVESDVEKKARERERVGGKHNHHHPTGPTHPSSGVAQIRQEDSGRASFGSSGAITKHVTAQRVFEGHGHSLRDPAAEDKMPQDVPLTESIQGAARRLQNFCDPEHNNQLSIREEPEKMDMESKAGVQAEAQEDGSVLVSPQPKYTRIGPGYSVLEPPPPPVETSDAVKQLFRSVQDAMETMSQGEEDDAEEGEGDGDGDEAITTTITTTTTATTASATTTTTITATTTTTTTTTSATTSTVKGASTTEDMADGVAAEDSDALSQDEAMDDAMETT
ncbi:deubiquitinating protein VCPIP1-like isoform X2 [Babylonia areolata]|uniref:deubiquitinating protein VCPIP1-like isoform X2 n=1 Tax=Babylonia areolata TaxID=304850 RepID=UPI003FD1F9BF